MKSKPGGGRRSMRSDAEYEEAMRWLAWGLNPHDVSRLTTIPRGTVSNWKYGIRIDRPTANSCPRCGSGELVEPTYAYMLGLYLGDGHILLQHPKQKGVYRLTITQDLKHIGLIGECAAAIESLLVTAGPLAGFRQQEGCIDVVSFWKHWPCLFPQHGPGRKDQRSMRLAAWQEAIAARHPDRLVRGLIHSDGCRYVNVVGKRQRPGGYRYLSYAFTNISGDIRSIFCRACDRLGVRYRVYGKNVTISRRLDVAKLDAFIGPKS